MNNSINNPIAVLDANLNISVIACDGYCPIVMLTDDRFAVIKTVGECLYNVYVFSIAAQERTFSFNISVEKVLVTVGLTPDDELLIITQDRCDRFAVEKVNHDIIEELYSINGYITNAVFRKDGSLAVGYMSVTEKIHCPAIRIFDMAGNITYEYNEPSAIGCGALSLDIKENVWFRLAPFGKLYCVENGKTTAFDCEVPNVTDFALSKDGESLLAGVVSNHSGFGYEPRIYLLERCGQEFVNPVLYRIRENVEFQQISLLQENVFAMSFDEANGEAKNRFYIGGFYSKKESDIKNGITIPEEHQNIIFEVNRLLVGESDSSVLVLSGSQTDKLSVVRLAVPKKLVRFFVSGTEFVEDMQMAIRAGDLESFRDDYGNADIVLLDDLEFVLTMQTASEELFNLLKHRIHERKSTILMMNGDKAISCNENLTALLDDCHQMRMDAVKS